MASAQKAKIRGDKNVVTDDRSFGYFTKLEVNNKIKLTLKQSKSTKLVIEADENLHDVIDSDFENGALVLSLNKRISSSKRFKLTLFVDDLDFIELNDDSELIGGEEFNFFDLEVVLNDKSDIKIEFESQTFSLESNEKSRGEFTIKADSVSIITKESSRIKNTINAEKVNVNYTGNSAIEFIGKASSLDLKADDNATFKGVELIAFDVFVDAANSTNSFVNAKNNLKIEVKDKARIYIFNSPAIEIMSFEDAASIFKRESMKLLEKI
jgi:hypothetical protein